MPDNSRLMAVMLDALRGIAEYAEQHILALAPEAGTSTQAQMEIARWNAVLEAIAQADGR